MVLFLFHPQTGIKHLFVLFSLLTFLVEFEGDAHGFLCVSLELD